MRAVLSIGSNMGDKAALLQTVFDGFKNETLSSSRVYSTPPWGVEDQAEFYNAILIVDVDQTPYELLRRCQELENAADRVREKRWGPRTLDVDIIEIDGYSSDDEELTVPHPRASERAFVLIPWMAADVNATLGGKPVAGLIGNVPQADIDGIKVLGRVEEL
ncbi:2-amino-4-hydroxy-6-hydroxymethyldihydropteridine diphosphokinase [Corynebacterium sp. L4756]|uniref:2-amino-4-hydroxy-6- hydroxymethyldihydropteridine diphosphokinase n=1 Tax=unclassified Corynebacterium TaxID=2624378 RepID=UPI00374D81F3